MENVNLIKIYTEARKALDITNNEYIVSSIIEFFSKDTGYCVVTRRFISKIIGLSSVSVHSIINKLITKGIVVKLPDNSLKVTDKFKNEVNKYRG